MNRREVFTVLASIPLIGFFFNEKSNIVNVADFGNKQIFDVVDNIKVETFDREPMTYIHIPQKNGMVMAIPLSKNFIVYHYDKEFTDGPTPVQCLSCINGKISENHPDKTA